MLDPWVICCCALLTLQVSAVASAAMVYGIGWRYTDVDRSLVTYTLLGSVVWPIVGLALWRAIAVLRRHYFPRSLWRMPR